MTLTKAAMTERLFEEVGLNKREAKEFVEAYFELLCESRARGEHALGCWPSLRRARLVVLSPRRRGRRERSDRAEIE